MFNDAWKIDRPFYFREGIYSFWEDFFLFSLSFVVQIYSSTIHSLTNFLENCGSMDLILNLLIKTRVKSRILCSIRIKCTLASVRFLKLT